MYQRHLVLLTILALVVVSPAVQCADLHGAEPNGKAEKSGLAERIATIAAEHEKQTQVFRDELGAVAKNRETLGPVEYSKQVSAAKKKFEDYQRPAAAALAELLKANSSDPGVVEGIIFYLGPIRRPVRQSVAIPPEFKTILLGEQFMNPALGKLCFQLRYVNSDAEAEAILSTVASRHPTADVRGIATYALGEYYRETSRAEWDRQLDVKKRTRLLQNAEQHFTEVLSKYASVKSPDGKADLGKLAASSLLRVKNIPNLEPGHSAPEFVGTDLNGMPAKLTDFRGKVVVLVYWGSWCGPCMARVPHERKLVERMKEKPFVLVGVNCGDTLDKARQTVEENGMHWMSLLDGDIPEGPLQAAYNVLHWPTVYVIDAKGVIQHIDIHGRQLDAAVDKLVAETESAK